MLVSYDLHCFANDENYVRVGNGAGGHDQVHGNYECEQCMQLNERFGRKESHFC